MKRIILIGVGVVIIVLVFLLLRSSREVPQTNETLRSYSGHGLNFAYPQGYFLREIDESTGERNRYTIVLVQDTPTNRDIVEGRLPGTDSPPTITISVFQNSLDSYTAQSFIQNHSASNFKLSDGKLTDVTVASIPALQYRASGLFENINTVTARPDYVYMFTVFYNAPTDRITQDYMRILETVQFGE